MNQKEERILEYLDNLKLQMTDPTQKQQDFYESKKHKILNLEHKHCDSDPSSPFSLREALSPISLFHTHSVKLCDINNDNTNSDNHHHHNQQIHHASHSFKLHLNIHAFTGKKVEI
ncbi:unnamed protein product (macronuclear) [Paramecium tetraurelia]|uniref:Uncharacterized protein n=1 Tax=Paramecium tetraurelia TaxID=5888 RepID=A0D8K2_PARTE|nr:uncharacterized protein GSPATT00014315001 [Paramecium tetraurelia]CAK79369.1 unnamed protein product [Paramecium tetraurelia]|eukprot:XP_001446766.1 hypothetical protein (macronuclear) [Paramecium tetraurelia strain d4-2]